MVTRFHAAVLFTGLLATLSLSGDEADTFPSQLTGRWIVTELVVGGTSMPVAHSPGKFWFQIEGTTWRYSFVVGGQRATAVFHVMLDSNQTPIAVDARLLKGKYANKICKGICRIDGDTFRLCLADKPSMARPDRFESPSGSDLQLFVMRRARTVDQTDKVSTDEVHSNGFLRP